MDAASRSSDAAFIFGKHSLLHPYIAAFRALSFLYDLGPYLMGAVA
jgi:hypothetical protein